MFLRRYPACEPLHLHPYSSVPASHLSRFAHKTLCRNVNLSDDSSVSNRFLSGFSPKVKHLQIVRWYLPSNRGAFRAQTTAGLIEAPQNSLELTARGQTFNRLSRNVNDVSRAENAPAYISRMQRRSPSQRASAQRPTSEANETTVQSPGDEQEDSGLASQANSGLQLFHISSLATRFGESYNYVAKHINSVFSLGFTKVQVPAKGEITKGSDRRSKKRKRQSYHVMHSKDTEISPLTSSADEATVEPNYSHSWEEGYRHFAKHINRYFGAKVTDDAGRHSRPEPLAPSPSHARHSRDRVGPETGLFHSGHNTTRFDRQKAISFMDCFHHPTRVIPDLLGAFLDRVPSPQNRKPKHAVTSPEAAFGEKLFLSHKQAEELTHGLIENLRQASSAEGLTTCVEMLNEHLRHHPSRKALMWQEKMAVTLLRQRRVHRDEQALQPAIREALALIGYVDPVKGRGIKVLSIDGGGTRGLVPLQVLKLLEAQTGKKIHQLFDYICGVSTGAVLAFMLGLAHFPLEECADMYRRFGSEVFQQNRLVGTVKMGWSHAYYNTETWETILREKLGDRVLIKTARNESSPKVSAVSAVVNWGNSPKAFIFCNYNHKPGSLSRYAGGSSYPMWQAVRASSAAPGYFQEFPLQSDIHQDGGIIMNNPCALAVHESRLLWPKHAFQCVLSLGTGRYDNAKRGPATSTSLRAKISNLISSATDTEGVHTLLDDLLPPDVYFRFNPTLSAEVCLDESRPGALDRLETDTRLYLERNRLKLARLCLVLGAERSALSKTKDWICGRAWEMKHQWV
ncbi:LOW QUALITY PROTEIN: calcium-independent phospholipase A2-gamma-like [Phyllopteryx taeniolatus]|uniref:LOW QUALITY PROTEIN: calcium-independent phospholipase A2-gamma-like n=1 Tax=Phyllopteryx taeniolatus TaxID=161469 RepID=UPI002AD287D8|nr:LOW QUALITY PROTEIN: calcium-independent phospholipase A2-gamma-like [Phyllopteryx taeniolatus]